MRKVEDLFEKFYGISIEFVEDDDGVGYEASLDYYIKQLLVLRIKIISTIMNYIKEDLALSLDIYSKKE